MEDLPRAVLFSCTLNSVRSPMAEGLLKHLLGHRIYVDSAGVRRGEIDPFAVAVMEEIGIDLSRHHAKSFDELADTSYDLIVSLSPEAQHMACEVEFWPIMDPTWVEGSREARLAAYREVRDELRRRIEARFALDLKPVP
jgi:protein-tyrosine-phosphatase